MSHPLLYFRNTNLFAQALTHRSYLQEYPNEQDNERLEFLGDAILNYLSGVYLYRKYPQAGEDELTRSRSALVDEEQLAKFALEVGLDLRIRMSRGLARDGGMNNPNLLSSAFEAVIGAFYLDRGNLDELQALIEKLFDSIPKKILKSRASIDAKNKLQEWAQANFAGALPRYDTQRIGGADHAPEYLARVWIGSELYGEGRGNGKKASEKRAAESALAQITRKARSPQA
jgi:ribonuclease-3